MGVLTGVFGFAFYCLVLFGIQVYGECSFFSLEFLWKDFLGVLFV